MKYLLFVFIITLSTCKSADTSNMLTYMSEKTMQTDDCKEGGTCKVEIFKNKDYTIEKDGIGKIYPKIVAGENIVVKYTYKMGNPNNYADGGESETLHFIITKEMEKELQNSDLQKIKLVYGKNCFCRDIQGFYKVEQGNFTLKSSKKSSDITIEFTIPKIAKRQMIKKVHFTLE